MPASALRYRVELHQPQAHLFQVTLQIAQPAALQLVSLPVWIPGSYLIREFAKNLQALQARQGDQARPLTQTDKCSWQIPCDPDQPLELSYQVYALDNSVRTAWLDTERAFFNGTSLFLRVHGQEASAHEVTLQPHADLPRWQVATGLPVQKTNARGFGTYRADSYDELVDCPVEMGAFWSGHFEAGGIPHRVVVAGAPPGFDGARLMADTQAICETEIRFWHGGQARAPHQNYLFLFNAVEDGYGGLEHRNSTALLCCRKDLPRHANAALAPRDVSPAGSPRARSEGYAGLLGLISHEYFHTWNVKRLRPAEFANYDYTTENYTQLLWFFEGFTSYYDDLLLLRAGLIDNPSYLKLLTKSINQVLQTPGRALQSVAQASFDAWVKYYRPDENTPNATVSYYSKGALVALCLDLSLRQEGKTTLDAVMQALWQRCQGGPMQESDLAAVLLSLSGRSFARELKRWVHGSAELPLRPLLEKQGIAVADEPAQLAQRLGLRVTEGAGLRIKTVLRGGAAERAGFAADDEWLGLETGSGASASQWRLHKLDDLLLYAGTASKVGALVARDARLLKLPLTLPKNVTTWRLSIQDPQRAANWLNAR